MNANIEPKAMALRGVHEGVVKAIINIASPSESISILDVGAGQGALSKLLHEAGYSVSACEFNKDNFVYNKVEFKEANVAEHLPYDDNTFDIVVAAELIEHLLDQTTFLNECNRVLKPGGSLVVSTPNILSLKSRLQFFSSGYYWSYDPLDMNDRSGLQHVTGRTVEQYQYMAMPRGLNLTAIDGDKYQGTSKGLLIFYPFMFLAAKAMKKNFHKNNQLKLMLSRIVIMTFKKD
jgi:ubiquinone/menaquinone biosynthesis C-methylase UbiE